MFTNPNRITWNDIKTELTRIRDTLPRLSAKRRQIDAILNNADNATKGIESLLDEIQSVLGVSRWTKKFPTNSLKAFNTWCLKNKLIDDSHVSKWRRCILILQEIDGNLSTTWNGPRKANIDALMKIITPLQSAASHVITDEQLSQAKLDIAKLLTALNPVEAFSGDINFLLTITTDSAEERFKAIFNAITTLATYITNTPRGKKAPIDGKETASCKIFKEWYELEKEIKVIEPVIIAETMEETGVSSFRDSLIVSRPSSASGELYSEEKVPSVTFKIFSNVDVSTSDVEQGELNQPQSIGSTGSAFTSKKEQLAEIELLPLSNIIYGESSSRRLPETYDESSFGQNILNEIMKISFVLGEMDPDNDEDEKLFREGRDLLLACFCKEKQDLQQFNVTHLLLDEIGKKWLLLACLFQYYLDAPKLDPNSKRLTYQIKQQKALLCNVRIQKILMERSDVQTQWVTFFNDKQARFEWFNDREDRLNKQISHIKRHFKRHCVASKGDSDKSQQSVKELESMVPTVLRELIATSDKNASMTPASLQSAVREQLFTLSFSDYVWLTQFSTPEDKQAVDALVERLTNAIVAPYDAHEDTESKITRLSQRVMQDSQKSKTNLDYITRGLGLHAVTDGERNVASTGPEKASRRRTIF